MYCNVGLQQTTYKKPMKIKNHEKRRVSLNHPATSLLLATETNNKKCTKSNPGVKVKWQVQTSQCKHRAFIK